VLAIAALRVGRRRSTRAALVAVGHGASSSRSTRSSSSRSALVAAVRSRDGRFWLALVLAAGVGAGRLLGAPRGPRRVARFALAVGAVLWLSACSLAGHDSLRSWPRAGAWPYESDRARAAPARAVGALRGAPAGPRALRALGRAAVYGTEWWRPHTHITALTPLDAGRAIVNGTFTHPSPIAALVLSRTDAGRRRSPSWSSASTAARSSVARSRPGRRHVQRLRARLGVSVGRRTGRGPAAAARARRQSRPSPPARASRRS
jgi:hypothetical protein